MSLHRQPGRHELGQNSLTDRRVIRAVVDLVAHTSGAIVEWGAGDGALTEQLALLGRPLEVVEIDRRKAVRLCIPVPVVTAWCRQHALPNRALPRDLNADQWAELHELADQIR